MLPEQESILGFETCQYLSLESDLINKENTKENMDNNKTDKQHSDKNNDIDHIQRFYHPLSQADDQGFVDFLIKLYPKQKSTKAFGRFSNFLFDLEVNTTTNITTS